MTDNIQWLFIIVLFVWCAVLTGHALEHSQLTKRIADLVSKLYGNEP